MRIQTGDRLIDLKLPAIDDEIFDIESIKGKPFMLSFLRFASCTFCNLRIHELTQRFNEFGDDFTIVVIFDSPLDNLKHHTEKHRATFPILADADNTYYKQYNIEQSVTGMLKGIIFRMPTLMKGMLKGYIPIIIKGSLTTMPTDFLIDRDGIVQTAYYGQDEGDHLPFDIVKAFSLR